MDYDRTLTRATIDRAVDRIAPEWRVREATPFDLGQHAVYRLALTGPDAPETAVLKATPPGKEPTCGAEARLLTVLRDHSSLPVPDVYGVVDRDDGLPTPFLLEEHLAGRSYRSRDLGGFTTEALRRLGRSTGRHLATLHDLDLVDAYGVVDVATDPPLDGARPTPSLAGVRVQDPEADWREYLASSVDRVLEGLAETRFSDVQSTVEPAIRDRVRTLEGPFEPVLCRIDNPLDNVLVDPEITAVVGLPDWEFTVAGTPAYDLAFVAHSLAGGIEATLPDHADRRAPVREALLEGYRGVGRERVLERFAANGDCYAALACLHAMVHFDGYLDLVGVGPARRDPAAAALRERLARRC